MWETQKALKILDKGRGGLERGKRMSKWKGKRRKGKRQR